MHACHAFSLVQKDGISIKVTLLDIALPLQIESVFFFLAESNLCYLVDVHRLLSNLTAVGLYSLQLQKSPAQQARNISYLVDQKELQNFWRESKVSRKHNEGYLMRWKELLFS